MICDVIMRVRMAAPFASWCLHLYRWLLRLDMTEFYDRPLTHGLTYPFFCFPTLCLVLTTDSPLPLHFLLWSVPFDW